MDVNQLDTERRVSQEIIHARNTRERLLHELDNLEAALRRARNEAEDLPVAHPADSTIVGTLTHTASGVPEAGSFTVVPAKKHGWRFPWKH